MIERDIQTALNDCIDRITAGESIQQCLEDYPQFANDLRPMLEAGNVIRRSTPLPDEIQAAQERVRFQVQRAAYELTPRSSRRLPLRTIASLIALLLVAFTGTGLLAQNSLPGDTLYGAKRLTERVINVVSGGDQPVEEQFAQRRIDEINMLLGLNRVETVDFRGDVQQIDGQSWQVGGLALTLTPDTRGEESIIVGDRVDVVAYTTPASQLVAQEIELIERSEELPPPSVTPQATPTSTLTETVLPSETATNTPSPDPTTSTPTPTSTTASSATPAPSLTPVGPAAQPTGTPTTVTEDETPSACQAPESWVAYTIQAGNTLSGLAGATGTTVEEVMRVNCIEDARFIVVGQIIYLPTQPQIASPAPSGGDDDNSGNSGGNNNNSGSGGNQGSGSSDDNNSSGDDDDDDGSGDDDDD